MISPTRIVAAALAAWCGACASSGDADAPDAGAEFACNDDALVTGDPGGNDTLATAVSTGIGDGAVIYSGAALSICPEADVDLFSLKPRPIFAVEARVFYDVEQGGLGLRFIGAAGEELAAGTDPEARGIVRSRYQHDSAESIFVEVRSETGAPNNYDVQIYVAE